MKTGPLSVLFTGHYARDWVYMRATVSTETTKAYEGIKPAGEFWPAPSTVRCLLVAETLELSLNKRSSVSPSLGRPKSQAH